MEIAIMTAIASLIGMAIGFFTKYLIDRKKSVGTLRIDNSDPRDNPYLFLELETDIKTVYKKKYVTLKVNIIDYIPRK